MVLKINKDSLRIVWRDPCELTPNPRNHRRHPDGQRAILRAALEHEGWIDPVIFNRRTGHIIDGHARVEEAIAQSAPEVPVIEIDVDEATERVILARHDRIGAMAEIDWQALTANLTGLDELGVDLDGLGWAVVPELGKRDGDLFSGGSTEVKTKQPQLIIKIPARIWLTTGEKIVAEINSVLIGFGLKVEVNA